MKELSDILESIGGIPNAEIQRFVELTSRSEVPKGSYFIREGCRTNRLGFVEKGLFRNLYLTENGEECTFAFSTENDFIYECEAMRTFKEAQYSIQAIENSTILEIDYKIWVEPFKDSAWWNKTLLDLTTSELSQKKIREIELMKLNGRERYSHFLAKYSGIESRVKQHIIASYLGITAESLSRIRKEMRLLV